MVWPISRVTRQQRHPSAYSLYLSDSRISALTMTRCREDKQSPGALKSALIHLFNSAPPDQHLIVNYIAKCIYSSCVTRANSLKCTFNAWTAVRNVQLFKLLTAKGERGAAELSVLTRYISVSVARKWCLQIQLKSRCNCCAVDNNADNTELRIDVVCKLFRMMMMLKTKTM